MKKLLLLFLATFISFAGYSQAKLGLRFAPNISFNRVQAKNNLSQSSSDGATVRFSFGPVLDYTFAPNYAFSTGLWFTTKRAAFKYRDTNEGLGGDGLKNGDYSFNLQYIQLPVTMKFFTNEVAPDMKVYFQLGGTADIAIAQKMKEGPFAVDNPIRPVDVGVLLGSGIEFVLGQNTIMFGGLSYNRGLLNGMKNSVAEDLSINNDPISLEVGIKF